MVCIPSAFLAQPSTFGTQFFLVTTVGFQPLLCNMDSRSCAVPFIDTSQSFEYPFMDHKLMDTDYEDWELLSTRPRHPVVHDQLLDMKWLTFMQYKLMFQEKDFVLNNVLLFYMSSKSCPTPRLLFKWGGCGGKR